MFSECVCIAKTEEKRTKLLRPTMKFQFKEVFDLAHLVFRMPRADNTPQRYTLKISTDDDTSALTSVLAFPSETARSDWKAAVEGAKRYKRSARS